MHFFLNHRRRRRYCCWSSSSSLFRSGSFIFFFLVFFIVCPQTGMGNHIFILVVVFLVLFSLTRCVFFPVRFVHIFFRLFLCPPWCLCNRTWDVNGFNSSIFSLLLLHSCSVWSDGRSFVRSIRVRFAAVLFFFSSSSPFYFGRSLCCFKWSQKVPANCILGIFVLARDVFIFTAAMLPWLFVVCFFFILAKFFSISPTVYRSLYSTALVNRVSRSMLRFAVAYRLACASRWLIRSLIFCGSILKFSPRFRF